MIYICDLLDLNHSRLRDPGLNVDKLEAIAGVRFALAEVAKLMYDAYVEKKHSVCQWLVQRVSECARRVSMLETQGQLSKPR